jgi:phenylacetate-CoA ligase
MVSGATFGGFDRIGCTSIALGSANTEQILATIRRFLATAICCTPSHGLYINDWCQERGIDPRTLGIRLMVTGGEPGGGEPLLRGKLAQAFSCRVRETMGISDVAPTVWAEDTDDWGMHLMARGFVHVELIDPASGEPLPFEDGARGELVYTALHRQAMPLLRFRSRDHVVISQRPNPTGRTGPRIRCIGRTDDMLIVRGQNLFPSAVREVLREFAPAVGPQFQIRLRRRGVAQTPPLPIAVELGPGMLAPPPGLRERLVAVLRERLTVSTEIELLPYGTLPRTDGKARLVDFSRAADD